jgi:hypothetical protein
MRRIAYSDAQFVTTNAIAAKVLDYARVMGRAGTDDVIQLPAVGEDGKVRSVEVLIGPASQITAVEVDGPEAELDAQDLLDELEQRIAKLRTPHADVDPAAVEPDYDPDLDADVEEPGGPR